jgi:dsRNA-specific ribonuclease
MKQYQPIYQGHTLILPSHLPEHVRYVYLPPLFRKSSKKLNESSLALIACVRLYEYKVINDRLLPLKREDIQNRLQLFALQTPKRVHVDFHKSIPLQTSEEKEIFIYPLLQNGILFEQNASSISGARGLCIISLISLDTLPAFSFKMTHRQIGLISCTIGQSKKEVIPSNQFEVCRQFYSAIMNARWRRRTGHKFFQISSDQESTFPSYIVSCLDKNNNLDWDFMNVAVREFQKDDNERKLSAQQWTGQYPRLFSPLYDPNNTYIAFGIEDDMLCSAAFPNKESSSELFESYCDYFSNKWNFKVAKDCKLLKVQRCWELPSKFNENCDEKNDGVNVVEEKESGLCFGLKTVLLPQDACMEAPIADPLLLLHTIALPHILYEIERLETVNRFIQHCTRWSQLSKYLDMIDTDKIQVVLTAKSCSVGDKCYDKLEYLGDAVLKLIHTDALINAKDGELRKWFHCLHEGEILEIL